jgi:hypothetical protein
MSKETPDETAVPNGGPVALRDGRGRFGQGNVAALVAGEHCAAFWAAQDDARREIVDTIVRDAGHVTADAPEALRLAAESVAQSTLLRDSAYRRLVESGGPMTANGRTRRAFTVWLAAIDRLEKHLRLVGLQRVGRPAPSLQDYLDGKAV